MRLPWGPGEKDQPAGRETLQAVFDRAIPPLADKVGLDLVAAGARWHAGGVGLGTLPEVLREHAAGLQRQCLQAGPDLAFPEHVRLYGPGRRGFWCCGLHFLQGLPEDRQPLPAFLDELARATGAVGVLQARVDDRWEAGQPTAWRVARLWTWDGQEALAWELALGQEQPDRAWEPHAGPPPYPALAGCPGPPAAPSHFPFDEQGRARLLNHLSARLRTQVAGALLLGKMGELPAPEGFQEAVHAQTLALQHWLEQERQPPGERMAELALLRPAGEAAVALARFSLRSRTGNQEAESWALLRALAEAWEMQGFVYALRASLVLPGRRQRPVVPVVLLHRWDGLVMQEAWAPVTPEGTGPWRVRPAEEGATPTLDGLCGYHLSETQRQNVEAVRAGKLPGAAVGEDLLAPRCRHHPGRVVGYECADCRRKGCSRCMTTNGQGRITCRSCAAGHQ